MLKITGKLRPEAKPSFSNILFLFFFAYPGGLGKRKRTLPPGGVSDAPRKTCLLGSSAQTVVIPDARGVFLNAIENCAAIIPSRTVGASSAYSTVTVFRVPLCLGALLFHTQHSLAMSERPTSKQYFYQPQFPDCSSSFLYAF